MKVCGFEYYDIFIFVYFFIGFVNKVNKFYGNVFYESKKRRVIVFKIFFI